MMKKIVISIIALIIIALGVFFVPKNLFSPGTKTDEKRNPEESQILTNDELIYEETYSADYLYLKPIDLYEHSDLTVIAEFIEDENSLASIESRITTLSNFKVTKVLKGKYAEKTIKVRHAGGTVPLAEYIKYQTKEQLEKKGLDNLSEEQVAKRKVSQISADYELSLKKGTKYVLFLTYDAKHEQYVALSDEYGMLEYSDGKVFDMKTKKYESYDYLK